MRTGPIVSARSASESVLPCGNRLVCFAVQACTGSLCAVAGQKACFCTGNDRCQVCCQPLVGNGTCNRLRDMGAHGNLNTNLAAGSPCDNYLGFCDFLSFCRRLDDQGPIARLKDTLFSSESIKNAYEWSKKYWYFVLLGVIGIVIIMALIIHFCSVHTESTVDTMRRKRGGGGGDGAVAVEAAVGRGRDAATK